MRTWEMIRHNDPTPGPSISVAKSDACDAEIDRCAKNSFDGRPLTPAQRTAIKKRAGGDPHLVKAALREIRKDSYGLYAGEPAPAAKVPANSPGPVASGASSSGGMPPELPISELDVWPDVLQFRTADVVAPRGGSAADTAARAWAASGRGNVDAPAGPILVFDSAPKQTAGDQLVLDCRRVAASLGIQDVNGLAKAIQAAVTSRRKG